jgi:hypothetical protein
MFAVTVAEIGNTGLDENAVIDNAIKMLSAGGDVKVNMPHRIYRVYGRQLSIQRSDGSRSMVGLFDYNGRLYLIEGKMAADGAWPTSCAFSNRWCSPMAALTAPPRRSAPFARPVAA